MAIAERELPGTIAEMADGRYLAFTLDNYLYGIDYGYVSEVIGLEPITGLPGFPEYLKGIINLRGKIVPVLDMRLRLKKAPAEYTYNTSIIIVRVLNMLAGFIVDGVSGVISVPEEGVMEPQKATRGAPSRFLRGYAKTAMGNMLLLDCEKLLQKKNTQTLN